MSRNMDNPSKKLNIQSYVDSVKTGAIKWDFFVQLLNDLCITKKRRKTLNSILLQEFRNQLQNQNNSNKQESRIHSDKKRKVVLY